MAGYCAALRLLDELLLQGGTDGTRLAEKKQHHPEIDRAAVMHNTGATGGTTPSDGTGHHECSGCRDTSTSHSLVHLLVADPALDLGVDTGAPHETGQLVEQQAAGGGRAGHRRLGHL